MPNLPMPAKSSQCLDDVSVSFFAVDRYAGLVHPKNLDEQV
jgi:hypothetical protein